MTHKPATTALLILAGLVLSVSMVQAQLQGEALGRLYLSASPDYHEPLLEAGQLEPFNFYVVAEIDYADIGRSELNGVNGMKAWEAYFTKHPDLIIMMTEFNPTNVLNFCDPATHYCVGLNTTFHGSATPITLVKITGLFCQSPPTDVELELRGAQPSSFQPSAPGWVETDPSGECFRPNLTPIGCRRPFAEIPRFRINCRTKCKVGTEEESWGAVKARFGG